MKEKGLNKSSCDMASCIRGQLNKRNADIIVGQAMKGCAA